MKKVYNRNSQSNLTATHMYFIPYLVLYNSCEGKSGGCTRVSL